MPNVDYPGAISMWTPEADWFTTNTHQAIVVHKTANGNTAQEIAQYFINASVGPSVHYVVGLDGTIVQCVPEWAGAGGNGRLEAGHDPFWDQFGDVNLNTVTFSVEHVDPASDNSTPCPQTQINASFKLISYLAHKYNIPADHIKPHSSIDPQSRSRCPGNYPFTELIAYVEGDNHMGIPTNWHDDGTTLTAPNGVHVVRGFRAFILNHPWDAADVPLAPETGANPVELAYNQPDGNNAGTRQLFLYSELCWTQARDVYRASVGREFATALQREAAGGKA